MSMYSKYLAFAMMGLVMSGGMRGKLGGEFDELTESEKAELDKIKKMKLSNMLLKKGCKQFNIDGFTVIALNEKNAIRKVNNIKKQLT